METGYSRTVFKVGDDPDAPGERTFTPVNVKDYASEPELVLALVTPVREAYEAAIERGDDTQHLANGFYSVNDEQGELWQFHLNPDDLT